MEAFLVSAGAVLLGEIGDKTQLLALLLAARFRRPAPLIAGILVATVFNHALAAFVGGWLRAILPEHLLPWLVGGSFIAVGLWALKPDSVEDDEAQRAGQSAFWVTAVSFFIAEIGDKTQLATTVLAARFGELVPVVSGTTLGMLLADVPVIFLGAALAQRLPLKPIRFAAAALFIVLGITTILLRGLIGPTS
ncbi:Putative Ca2+/H+ antiporter, TMEM165/GDT1 family [Solimonas aquatica]|uniref:GDT1 family protein n=1 Tax=Solimonas aquatica TaxID=489703 RepID=A0A1H9KXH6_9GAMM|nr:TMEM165/GDT1 family protein [Solimonas aquatica]SER03872.1 Putative Ca2+/H+ antiporter, TMEM165/GDT1 family [Solimonas aquatica]